jgi:hypothetical protein
MLGLDAWAAAARLFAVQLEKKCFYHQVLVILVLVSGSVK